jgi:hypothetical protein
METGERNAAGQPLCLNKKKNPNSNAYDTQCSGTTFVPMAYMDYDAWEECYVWEVQQFFGSDPYPDLVRDLHQGPSAYNPVSNDLWKRVGRKAGWQPWHVVGDYSIVSNCEGNRVNQDGTLDKIADARSIATWKVFEQLGIFGLYGYTTPGELALLQVSSTNETTAVIEGRDNSQNYRRGEIPWMLGTKNATVTTRCISSPASASVANVAVNRTNFYGNMPTYMNMSREPGCVGAPAPLAIDLGIFNSRNAMCGQRTRQHLTSTQIQSTMMFRHAQPMALAYPVTPMRTYLTGSWNYDAMNWDVMYPLLPLSLKFDEIATSLGEGQTVGCLADGGQCRTDSLEFHEKQYLARLLSPLNDASVALASNEQWRVIRDKKTYQTWHLPRHYQDDPVAPALHAGSGLDLGLATSIRRYRFNGVDHAWCQIQVVDSEGKPVQALHFKTLSTNFRGARVYWGKKGEITDNFGNSMRIGDSFE